MNPTLFISDLHLEPGQPAVTERFLGLLAGPARQAAALYILGDLFEAWIGDDDDSPLAVQVCDALAATATHTPVHLCRGNRDFLLGPGFTQRSGCRLMAEQEVVDLYGTPTLLCHGDELCTDDHAYQAFRAQVRDPAWQAQVLALPLAQRRAMAAQLRDQSVRAGTAKSNQIMDVNPQAVTQAMARHGVQRLIHGHTHRPAHHRLTVEGAPAERIVLADWRPQEAWMLVCDAGGCRSEPVPA